MKNNANLQKEIKKLEEGKKKLIDTLKKKISKEKENEDVIKRLTDKNVDLVNECKTLKKLYEEEAKKGVESSANITEGYIDYDNVQFDDEDSDVEEVPIDIISNNRNKDIQCDHCSYRTADVNKLKAHKSECHQKFNCDHCKFTFQHESLLQQHKKEVHELKTSKKCNDCSYKAKSEQNMREHRLNVHKRSNIGAKNNIQNEIQCEFCDYVCNTPYDMNINEHKDHKQTQ